MKFKSTAEIRIPKDPLDQVLGQDEAVNTAKICASQKRHLLLVAPPGTGKSMIAQAIAYHLPTPSQEVSVLHNPENPERPLVEVNTRAAAAKEKTLLKKAKGRLVEPVEVPSFVAERLGFRCVRCSSLSQATEPCPKCGADKISVLSPFPNIYVDAREKSVPARVHTTRLKEDDSEEVVVYERAGEKVRVLDQGTLQKLDALQRKKPRKVIIPFDRKTFVVATGASETELLGDVRHDPYGGHAQVGTQPYLRVVPGSIHEAHEGVLFIDELSSLAFVQRFLLTAMQERKYSIVGRNPQSAGASVRVDGAPCDFVLVAASNINDLPAILPPLRSRIIGNGYEVLLEAVMPDSLENRGKLVQFVAQEIRKDNKIPHASKKAVDEIIEVSRTKAKEFDDEDDALTLRFRELSGIVRLAGDLAVSRGDKLIEPEHVREAVERGKSIEQQLMDKYGSLWRAAERELPAPQKKREQKEVG